MRGKTGVNAFGPYKHGRRWRVHFVTGSGGDRKTTYEVFDTRAAAQKCYDAATDEAEGVTVSAAITSFLEAKRRQGCADLTIVTYGQRLNGLLTPLLQRPISSVARRGADLYAAAVEGRGADTHHNMVAVARIWARWCIRQGLLNGNPFAEVELVGKKKRGADKIRLTIDESRRLEAWCIEHQADQRAVLTLAYLYLGTRNTEVARRTIRDLDNRGSLLWIGRTKSAAGERKLTVPEVLGAMMLALCAGRAGDAPIFTTRKGRPVSRNRSRLWVREVCALAGVPVVPPQALRRTQASLATEAGETSLAVARHLGHATGAAPKVTGRSYIEHNTAVAAQGARALRVIRGGQP